MMALLQGMMRKEKQQQQQKTKIPQKTKQLTLTYALT